MNDLSASGASGGGGGSDSGMPSLDFKPLNVHVDSVASLGAALLAEADHMGNHAKKIKAKLKVPEGDKLGKHPGGPVGTDPRQHTLHHIAKTHAERIAELRDYLNSAETGIRNLGLICQAIAAQYGDRDHLNGAELKSVIEIVTGKPPTTEA